MKKLQEKFQKAVQEMNARFYERQELSTIMVAATLARFHTFILGSAGVAKSDMVRTLGSIFQDARIFDRPCHPTQSLSEVIGPIKVSEMKKGNDVYERKLVRYLADADIAFLDEMGRSSGPLRDAIMSIANERIYWNGDTLVECPLQCLFTGSNHLLTDSRDAAFMDRFLYCHVVADQIREEKNFRKLIRRPTQSKPDVNISIAELKKAQGEVKAMGLKFSELTEDALYSIKEELLKEGIKASPRTWRNLPTALSAFAYLEGDSELLPKHLEWLADALWTKPEERNVILAQIGKVANPCLAEAVRKLDRLKSEYDAVPEDHTEPDWIKVVSAANGLAATVVSDLEDMINKSGETTRMKMLVSEAKGYKEDLKRRCGSVLGVNHV
jgi:MoxR-like ATPase